MKMINKNILNRHSIYMNSWRKIYLLGILVVLVLYMPLIILNKDALLVIHDQLDGEVLSYVLSARNILSSKITQLFDGVNKSAITPPAPFFVLLYCLFPEWIAFFVSYILIAAVAYTGMFLCFKELLGKKWIALSVAIIFSLLPFYPVYGFSIMGQPLLLYACLTLYKGKRTKSSYLLIVMFATSTSLVLSGYVDLLLLGTAVIYLFIVKNENRKRFAGAFLTLLLTYIILNFELLQEMLMGVDGFVSHKEEVIAQSLPIRQAFWDMLINGQYHAVSLHKYIWDIAIIAFFSILTGYRQLQKKDKERFYQFTGLIAYAIFVAGFYAFWKFLPIVKLRNYIGGFFVSFQVDRFYWLYPIVWYLILGYILYFISLLWDKGKLRLIGRGVIVCVLILCTWRIWEKSILKINFNKLKDSSYIQTGYASWNEFYATELFTDIKEYINKPISEYKVGSIGLYPSIALYNGFSCVDGYSNNYDIEYKRKFGKVIEGELAKNEDLRKYYDEWGNRCYLFSSEIPFQYYIGKNSQETLKNLELDFSTLKEMECEYVFSALPIENREFELTFEKKFEVETSPYCVYLYRIK